jgi:hypothetical protein
MKGGAGWTSQRFGEVIATGAPIAELIRRAIDIYLEQRKSKITELQNLILSPAILWSGGHSCASIPVRVRKNIGKMSGVCRRSHQSFGMRRFRCSLKYAVAGYSIVETKR